MGKIDDNSLVTIKPLAYYKMLLHVLRFGSKVLEKNKLSEVMGVLIGHLEGEGEIKNVIVEDVAPVSHGGMIEVKFTADQLGAFEVLDSRIYDEFGHLGWFSVGWFHSHPGLSIFFSETDKFNQIFWQKNPSGIGIVFDHTYLEKPNDLGFRVFRLDEKNLDDPTRALKSDYHEVKAIVEPPDSFNFYLKLMELINKIHTREPQILELNETVDLFGNIFIPEEEHLEVNLPEINFNEMYMTLKEGIDRLLDHSIKPLIYFMNSWGQDIIGRIQMNSYGIRNDLKELKEKLSKEITTFQHTFNYNLQDDLKKIDDFVFDKLEEIDSEKENITDMVRNSVENYKDQIIPIFTEKIQQIIVQIKERFDNSSSNLVELTQKYSNHLKTLEQGCNALNGLKEKQNSIDKFIQSNLNTAQEDVITAHSKSTNRMKSTFNNLNKETKGYLSNLKAAIILLESLKNPIKEKLNSAQSENKELQKIVGELRSENQSLKIKIKKFEKEGGEENV
ncbi:MAG: hypothetical protein ACFFD7_05020 [Candidatus Thorarchaeota archaeon]